MDSERASHGRHELDALKGIKAPIELSHRLVFASSWKAEGDSFRNLAKRRALSQQVNPG
jgi:hypothetical protein